jgi:hypothetical protein
MREDVYSQRPLCNVAYIFVVAQRFVARLARNRRPDDHVRGFYCQAGPLSVIVIV